MPLILLLLLLVAAPARAVTVDPARKMFIGGTSELAAIRARNATGQQNAGMAAALKAFASSYFGSDASRAYGCGAYEMLTGNTQYGIAGRMVSVWLPDIINRDSNGSTGDDIGAPTGLGEGIAFGRVAESALLFNWYKDGMTPSGREDFARFLARARNEVAICTDTHCEPWRYTNTRLNFMLAARGETNDPVVEAELQAKIDADVYYMETAVVECRDMASPNGEDVEYRFYRQQNFIANYCLLKTVTNYSGPLDDSLYLQNAWKFDFHSMRPVMMVSPKAAYYVTLDSTPDKWNVAGWNMLALSSFFGCASPSPNAYARNLAKTLRDNGRDFGNQTEATSAIMPLIWLDTTDPGTDWTTAPLEFWNPVRAWYFTRQAWNLATTTPSVSAVRVGFWGNVAPFDATSTAGAFAVWRNDDNIFNAKSSWRDTDVGLGYNHWDAAAWSRNCTIIYNPTVDVDVPRACVAAGCTTCENTPTTITRRDLGKQTGGVGISGNPDWPECAAISPEDGSRFIPKRNGYTTRHVVDAEIGYTVVTLELAHGDTKVNASARGELRVLLPDYPGQGFGILWDEAVLKPGVKNFLFTANENNVPHVDGIVEVLRGGGLANADSIPIDADGFGSGNTQGGVYRTSTSTRIISDDGTSRGCLYPLHVTDDLGSARKLFVVGGPNKNGVYWRQDWASCLSANWVARLLANPATGGTSYDVWVDPDFEDGSGTPGRNHPPGTYPEKTCGTIACGDGTTIPRCAKEGGYSGDGTLRNNMGFPNGNGADSGWGKVYSGVYGITIPSGQTDHASLVHAWWAGPQQTPPDVYSTLDDDQVAFAYRPLGAPESRVVVVPAPLIAAALNGCTYANPLFGSLEPGPQENRVLGLEGGRRWSVRSGSSEFANVLSTSDGTIVFDVPTTVSVVTIIGSGVVTPVGACCLDDGACSVTIATNCLGDYQGDNTVCTPNPCPQPTGACCVASVCSITEGPDCTGTYQGDGSDCSPDPCPQPPATGACCVVDLCSITTSGACAGTWQGADTDCSPNPCPPLGACCISTACTATIESACAGEWQGAGTECNGVTCSGITACVDATVGQPRTKHLLQAPGGTLLALWMDTSSTDTTLAVQLSRDDGQTWRSLEGVQGEATTLWQGQETGGIGSMPAGSVFEPAFVRGFAAALDGLSGDLWVTAVHRRYNAGLTFQDSGVSVRRYTWDGLTWDAAQDATFRTGQYSKVPADPALVVTREHQAYAAWPAYTGSAYAVYSVRMKASTLAALSTAAARASSAQYPQLVESPAGTVWLLSSVNTGAVDSVRVRSTTDGGSAQWGTTSRIAMGPTGTAGHFSACSGPTGPAVVAYDSATSRYLLAYRSSSSWGISSAPTGSDALTGPCLVAAGATRVCLSSQVGTGSARHADRAYWSPSDGWSTWATVWSTVEHVALPHLAALSPTRMLLYGCVATLDGHAGVRSLDTQAFSLPPESEPTGACCAVQDGGPCTITTQSGCAGVYQGDYTECDIDTCSENHTGACCYPDGTCVVTTLLGCTGAGNAYQGDDTDCEPNPCPAGPPSPAGRRRRVVLAARE